MSHEPSLQSVQVGQRLKMPANIGNKPINQNEPPLISPAINIIVPIMICIFLRISIKVARQINVPF